MSSTIFKRLFEVQIVHDYFLTASDGTSFFERNRDDKNEFLIQKLKYGLYDVGKLFTIEPTKITKFRMNEYRLLLGKTILGFIVGTEVTVTEQAGETVYQPRFVLPENLSLTFSIRSRSGFFGSVTNLGLTPSLPAIHYFTNKDKEEFNEVTVPTYTSLPISNKAKVHQNGSFYEMGAIVDFGGTIREALQKTDGNDPTLWEDVFDRRFVSDADSILLPNNFTYTLKKENAVTQISFVLEDEGGIEIKAINKSGTTILESVPLNFTQVDENDKNSAIIPPGFYTLKITPGGSSEIAYPVYLNATVYEKGLLGMVDIRLDETNSPFSLLDTQGFLKTRIDAGGAKVPHPVFEVRFKNRRTYWRYNRDDEFSPTEKAATVAHLQFQDPKLVSIKPKALTEALVPFINGASLLLPPPRPSIKVEGDRIFSEVYINPSNRLLN